MRKISTSIQAYSLTMRGEKISSGALIGLFLTLFLFPISVFSQEIAHLDSAEGMVEAHIGNSVGFAPVKVGAVFGAHDVIHTSKGAKAGVLLANGSLIRLAENTSLEFQPKMVEGSRPLAMSQGKAFFFNREPKESPIVSTPSATTAIRGTEFALEVSANRTVVSVLDGAVNCSNQFGSVDLQSGEQAEAKRGSAPQKSLLIHPLNAVQWSLYFPVVITATDLARSFSSLTPSQEKAFTAIEDKNITLAKTLAVGSDAASLVAQAVIAYREGSAGAAVGLLDAIKGPLPVGVTLFRISLALSQGDSEQAAALLRTLSAEDHRTNFEQALILAQKSILSLAVNDNQQSLTLARSAYQKAPESSSAALALSYALQGTLQLEEAKEILSEYTNAHPNDGLALARLAELELGFGHLETAVQRATQSLSADPHNWYGQSVLGFSKLLVGKSAEAEEYFQAAIASDSTAALPRLGLGLTRIHRGALEEGQQELTKAVVLAPNVAVYRSYLGKAFFEEEREPLALHEYDRAIALDEKDPTPFLYRAFSNLSRNMPVLALRDVEQSIRLNDNRAVYRSTFLLDQDLAVRSASLAEAFTALGFSELARTEAIKSLSHDYGNYSAHLLLSDSYQSIITNDAAVAERKIAELLSPPSFNLFQRQAGEASLNEYNALFERPDVRRVVGADYSSYQDHVGAQATYAQTGEDYGFALGYRPLFDGGRTSGNYAQRERGYFTSAYSPAFGERILFGGDASYEKSHDPEGEPTDTRFETYSVNTGFFTRIDSNSKVIADLAYSRDHHRLATDFLQRTIEQPSIFEGESFEDSNDALINELAREYVRSTRAGVQHIFDSSLLSAVSGVQYYRSDADRNEESLVLEDSDEIFTGLEYYLTSHQANILNAEDLYEYATLHLTDWAHLTAGFSWSHVTLEDREVTPFLDSTHSKTRVNPKVGLTLLPFSGTTIRAAYFETLRKSALEDNLSIEPTLVGGINQRFTDFSGARARNFGLGLDQKVRAGTYLGGEVLRRYTVDSIRDVASLVEVNYDDATITTPEVLAGTLFDNYRTNDVIKSYFYTTLGDHFAASVDYEYSQFRRTDPDLAQKIANQHARGVIRYFDSSGFFPFASATWRRQNRHGSDFLDDGANSFVLADVGMGYRLPNRHGAIVLQLSNIFNKDFVYDQSLGSEPFVHSGIGSELSFTLNF